MKKPMLGILAICVLQMGFVAYNAIDLPFDSASLPPVGVVAPILASKDVADDAVVVFRSPRSVPDAPTAIKRARIAFVAAKRLPKVDRPSPARPLTMSAAKRSVRPKVRTEYPIAPLVYNGSNKAYSASVATKSAKKKGFFGKVFPIIKKPYDWAKAFAGKLK